MEAGLEAAEDRVIAEEAAEDRIIEGEVVGTLSTLENPQTRRKKRRN